MECVRRRADIEAEELEVLLGGPRGDEFISTTAPACTVDLVPGVATTLVWNFLDPQRGDDKRLDVSQGAAQR